MPLPQKRLIPGILLALIITALAAPPLWWSTANPPVIDPAASVNNRGPANIGQAKHMAKSALDALRPILPDVADAIEVDLAAIVDLTVPDPKPVGWSEKQRAPLLIGQLKAIADPFYTHLNTAAPHWLEAERITNGTNHPGSIFPWTTATSDDNNKGMANIGQLKAVFSLKFETVAGHDTDSDGMPDLWEVTNNLDPLDPSDASMDASNNGFSNLEVYLLGSAPNKPWELADLIASNPIQPPPDVHQLVITGDGDVGEPISAPGPKTVVIPPGGPGYLLMVVVESKEFPEFTRSQSQWNDTVSWSVTVDGSSFSSGSLQVNDLHQSWLQSVLSNRSHFGWRPVHYSDIKLIESDHQNPVTVVLSAVVTNIEDNLYPTTAILSLLPVEVAPEVLAVNSDFDEGRIDPATGYAIPDCDDMPGVDRKTGAGNTALRIDTDREHLDGLYANDERVTDDMYKGWFGVNPTQLDDDFWDGATVTINKIDTDDPDTGRKESGQIRFYAKWGDPKTGDYYGIEPYKINIAANGAVSYTANNLVTSGVNGRAGEGVYGSTSTIPDDAEFWMEGVRPGKITLEWRLQKGDIDVKHEQTFLVCTEQSKAKWQEQLTYMIRLQTDDDPEGTSLIFGAGYQYGGQEDVSVSPTAAAGYASNVDRASEYYDFYEQCWNHNNSLSWSGLAKVVGAQVISGISDSQWGIVGQLGFVNVSGWLAGYDLADIKAFQLELFKGGEAIFKDVGWQHYAYLASGICALEFVHENQAAGPTPDVSEDVLEGWKLIDDGDATVDASKILNGSIRIADYEQNTVIVDTYTNLDAIGGGGLVNAMSYLAVNPVQGGDHFRDVAGLGAQLSNTGERWEWVTAGLPGFGHAGKKGVLKAWDSLTQAQKDGFANEDLRVGARRFSVPWILTTVDAPYLPNLDVQVWDHLDQPGKQ